MPTGLREDGRASLKILTLNVNGIREEEKLLELGAFMAKVGADVYVLPETHLARKEARGRVFPAFQVANDCSLAPDA